MLFVSHNMAIVQALCPRGIVLERGHLRFDGTIDDAISLYLKDLELAMATDLSERTDRTGWQIVKLTRLQILAGVDGSSVLTVGSPVSFVFDVDDSLPSTSCRFTIYDHLGNPVAEFRSSIDSPEDVEDRAEPKRFVCTVDDLPLVPGRYRVDVEIWARGQLQDGLESAATFDVEPGVLAGRPVAAGVGRGHVAVSHRWTRPAV